MNPALDALASFLDDGSLVLGPGRVLVPRAEYHPLLKQLGPDRLFLQQTYKPHVDVLASHGLASHTTIGGSFPTALYVTGRSKKEGLYWMARALDALDEGGMLIVSGENDLGVKSFRKQLLAVAEERFSDHRRHCAVFAVTRRGPLPSAAREWLAAGDERFVGGGGAPGEPARFATRLGIFGWDKIDAGSRLLARHLPVGLTGTCADFGAGNGYLSYHALRLNPGIGELTLFEAEHLALDAAAENLATLQRDGLKLDLMWTDVLTAEFSPRYQTVLVNPPCHDTRGLNRELGHRFIVAAAAAVAPGGRMLLVANENLDYERTLRPIFSTVVRLAAEDGFKVLEAVR